jgi:hypothetical protein
MDELSLICETGFGDGTFYSVFSFVEQHLVKPTLKKNSVVVGILDWIWFRLVTHISNYDPMTMDVDTRHDNMITIGGTQKILW